MSKKVFATLSLPVDELDRLREIASQEHRSLAGQVTYWMEQHEQALKTQKKAGA